MRVLQLIDSLAQGGAERSLVDLAPHLRAAGVEPAIVVLAHRPGMEDEARSTGTRVLDVAGAGGVAGATLRAARLLRREDPALVHTTLFGASVVGRLAGAAMRVPVVTSLVNTPYGDDQLERLGALRVRGVQAVDIVTARAVRRFHANAEHVADVMARRLLVPRDRIDVIARGRDPELLGRRTDARRASVRASLDLGDEPVVLALARHEHQKGLDVLLDALSDASGPGARATLLIAGREGSATGELAAQAAARGIAGRVRFLGYRDDVADLLVAADAFVLPSRREGFPGVVVEAMATGCPIVTSDVPGALEALGSGASLVVPIGAAAALAAAIDEVLADPEGAAARAALARARFVERYATPAIADAMAAFYRRAVGEQPLR